MLSSFPEPYPDELLYSVLARYHIRHGNMGAKVTLREVFDNAGLTPAYDLPCSINSLVSNLPLYNRHTVEDLINNNTMFPYYTAFLPEERAGQIKASMISDFGGDILTRCGIVASRIKVPQFLRFCPLCNQEDQKEYGENYWHRLFQLPGVQLCSRHGVFLENSTVLAHNKHDLIAANRANCRENTSVIKKELTSRDFKQYYDFTKEVIWLLENYQWVHVIEDIRNRYLYLLMERGLATPAGRVDQKEFAKSFLDYYGHEYLQQLQSDLEIAQEDTWLNCIVRKHRKAFHPVSHILMIKFLSNSLEEFCKLRGSFLPYGEGPWPCLNIAAKHYMKNTIKDIEISYSADTKQIKGTFSCQCGFTYIRWGSDNQKVDRFSFDKVKEYGPVWESVLKKYLFQKFGLRDIARRLKVDPKTIRRQIDRLDLETSPPVIEIKEVPSLASFEDTRDYYRNEWEQILLQNLKKTKTELRNENKACYIWLYRNDREWLDSFKYYKILNVTKPERIDWEKRDIELCELVNNVINELIFADSKPIRITISAIGKRINKQTLLNIYLDKLPLTKEYLERNIEGQEDFHRRKIKWAIKKLLLENKEPVAWRIIKTAGIKNYKTSEIALMIKKEQEHLLTDNY